VHFPLVGVSPMVPPTHSRIHTRSHHDGNQVQLPFLRELYLQGLDYAVFSTRALLMPGFVFWFSVLPCPLHCRRPRNAVDIVTKKLQVLDRIGRSNTSGIRTFHGLAAFVFRGLSKLLKMRMHMVYPRLPVHPLTHALGSHLIRIE
jgi:hypothetical protein